MDGIVPLSGAIYNELSARISSSLEENILHYVAQEQPDGNISRSRSDVMASHIQDGVVGKILFYLQDNTF